MPSAGDPTLFGPMPISHDPLQRISFQGFKTEIDLEAIEEQIRAFITDFLFPAIEELTGIDLSIFLPLLDILDLDFSDPAAFLLSLINAITALPAVLGELLVGLISQLTATNGINLNSITELVDSIFSMIVTTINDLFGIDLEALGVLNPTLSLERLMEFIPGLGGGTFDLPTTAEDFIQNILTPTGLLMTITEIVEMFTGISGGDSTDLTAWIEDLFDPANFTSLMSTILDTLSNLSLGDVPPGDEFNAIGNALSNIPFLNILGIGGPSNIGDSLQTTWDKLIGGLVGAVGSGAGLSDLFNISQIVSSRARLGEFSWDILGIRGNKSLNTGLLPTSESNFGLDKVALNGSAPTFALTQSTAIMAFQRISEGAAKGAVSWLGSGVTSLTHAFVNIYKMDTLTGALALVHESANIIGDLSGSMQYNVYVLPTPINVVAGEVYGIEVAVRGAGTHSIVGSSTWLPNHPGVYPRRLSAVRNSGTSAPPSTIATGSVSYATNVPFMEFGISAGDVDIPHTPQQLLFNSAGSSSIPIPSWANFVERIVLGGGGGGRRGGGFGLTGEGGDNGAWAASTLVRGTDFTGVTSISITVGAGGFGGSSSAGESGGNGGTSSASITGHILTAAGGVGGNDLNFGGTNKNGQSPGNITYEGVPYVGGGTQSTFGASGAAPGGGGAGGSDSGYQAGGAGAVGAVWIRFRQS